MIVVSDTSSILNLARIGRLELLPELYRQVLIPSAVSAELAAFDMNPVFDCAYTSWLQVANPGDQNLVRRLRDELDFGEAEAIALAVERRATLLLMDEKHGREVAERLGISVTGLIGVLADAKAARLIESVKPVLDELITKARFWIGPNLYREVLVKLGEI
ncbi:MAG: DUF3368 domain-containing protein [Candidatus Korobacteraceae bacterium]